MRENATVLCGFLGLAQFDAAASLLELHHLHQRCGSGSPSYCLPLPVGLRPKGSLAPLFSNQVAMLMLQFFPHQCDSLSTVVAALKSQTEQAMRTGLLDNGRMLSELSRCIPLPIYMAIVKYSLGGEICSLFYGDAGHVSAALTTFLGVPVTDVAHVAAVTVSPGIGVIFCRFQQQLRLTIIHAAPVISDSEAAEICGWPATPPIKPVTEHFDIAVVGSGAAGSAASVTAARAGARTVVIDAGARGGRLFRRIQRTDHLVRSLRSSGPLLEQRLRSRIRRGPGFQKQNRS